MHSKSYRTYFYSESNKIIKSLKVKYIKNVESFFLNKSQFVSPVFYKLWSNFGKEINRIPV